jgi:hypothetical protein
MMADRIKRVAALGAATVAMTAGALFGAAGAASAAPAHDGDHARHHCSEERGHWAWVWVPAHRDHRDRGDYGDHRGDHGRGDRGHWERVWQHGDRDCHR